MDRRQFTKVALTVLGAAAAPATLRAQMIQPIPGGAGGSGGGPPEASPVEGDPQLAGSWPPRPVVPPIAIVPPGPLPPPAMPALPRQAAIPRLLDRAKGALDRHKDRLGLRDRVALIDFSAASSEHRFHVLDLTAGQSVSYLCAHGRGSDPEHTGFLQSFSNEPGSLATSEGAFVTGDIYDGSHGASMRLTGLDPSNSNAETRAIVLHGAAYVSEDHIAAWSKVGRSEGCFVVPPHLIRQVLALLGPGRLIYAAKI